jgi:predicted dehydrogenase
MKSNRAHKTAIHFNRRTFLKGVLAGGAASVLTPQLLRVAGAAAPFQATPNARVNVACVGIGNRGADDIRELQNTGLANIVALCDTDLGAPHTTRSLNAVPDAKRFQDFRKMFDTMARDIDAVMIATPDFSHFPIAMLAMSLGKHVYVEKPVAHSYRQIALMMQAEKKYKVATARSL